MGQRQAKRGAQASIGLRATARGVNWHYLDASSRGNKLSLSQHTLEHLQWRPVLPGRGQVCLGLPVSTYLACPGHLERYRLGALLGVGVGLGSGVQKGEWKATSLPSLGTSLAVFGSWLHPLKCSVLAPIHVREGRRTSSCDSSLQIKPWPRAGTASSRGSWHLWLNLVLGLCGPSAVMGWSGTPPPGRWGWSGRPRELRRAGES